MSAFEVKITPTRLKNRKLAESRQPTLVMMSPFSIKSIVQFEDVPVTKTAKRILRVMNPSDDDIVVNVTKTIKPQYNLTISWTEKTIPLKSEIEMEMEWNPQNDFACKEVLQLTDNRNFQKDVTIILKTKVNNPTKNIRKYPTISSGVNTHKQRKTLRLKSPKGAVKNTSKHIQKSGGKMESNRLENRANTRFQSRNENVTISITSKSPLAERNVYLNCRYEDISPILNGQGTLKENISPLTPVNVISFIDKLNFTPATETSNIKRMTESLATLPTPVTTAATPDVHLGNVRPRRLIDDDLMEKCESNSNYLSPENCIKSEEHLIVASTDTTAGISNRTFEMKPTDTFDLSVEISDSLQVVESCSSNFGITLNKTTTISATPSARALERIQEEDSDSLLQNESMQYLQNTYVKPVDETQNLKRDIILVGTPLQKHSESMKNLSLKSPHSKLAIQGSMPNLNEMESIRSIEQNRYFHQNSTLRKEINSEHRTKAVLKWSPEESADSIYNLNDLLNASTASTVLSAEPGFRQSEILAQSSRFNINEVGLKTRQSSPVLNKTKTNHNNISQKNISPKVMPSKKLAPMQKMPEVRQKRNLNELSFMKTPSTESLAKSGTSPPKRQRLDADISLHYYPSASASVVRAKGWSNTQQKKFKLAKTLSLMKRPITPRRIKEEPRIKLYDSELYLQSYINPDPFAATTTCDPFLASTMYLDEQAVDRHQSDFKKWLNALVSMPPEFNPDCNAKIDVGRLFNEVRQKDLILAPTKEEQSMSYLTNCRLEVLRRAAIELFLSEEMRLPCSKVAVYVNKNALCIRKDRNLHLDVVLQRYILELLLNFNPLWLRLGLEVVYGEKVHLHSSSDIVGLSTFILNRLFRDKFLEQKYSKAYTLSEEYADHIKKFSLQKFLFLLLFLDKAKNQRIIKHNPCLFVRKSPYKETKDILLKFASELLANIGDITRELKRLGYVLTHKQTYLDEFDYAFNNLAVDLRDGVRLTRIMEIILLRDDLTKQLRVPAISRLQRIFNVNLALRALSEADFQLSGDITAADIVDGHREKTLSLLWQIIYKFRSPKFHAAARVLQNWWRQSWLRVVIKRRIINKEILRRQWAAIKIQSTYRGYLIRKWARTFREERTRAAVIFQKHIRRYLSQKRAKHRIQCVLLIQRYFRGYLLLRECRQYYRKLRDSTIFLQKCVRRKLLAKQLLLLVERYRLHCEQRRNAAAKRIQVYWRSYCLMKTARAHFLSVRNAAVVLQRRMRAKMIGRKQYIHYVELRIAALRVQRRFRANKQMLEQRTKYLHICKCIRYIQQKFRATLRMRPVREQFLHQRSAIVAAQKRMRATRIMRTQFKCYQEMRKAALVLQRRYRAQLAMKAQLTTYKRIRESAIFIQKKWRATLFARQVRATYISIQYHTMIVQQKFRANKLMRKERAAYQSLKAAAIRVQQRFRAKLQMRLQRATFVRKQQAASVIQCRFRAYKQMRFQRAKYQGTRTAVTCLQQHFRAFLAMKRQRREFCRQRSAAVVLQRQFRARLAMLKQSFQYSQLRRACVCIQMRYRARLQMRCQMQEYLRQRNAIIKIQQRYRTKLLTCTVRDSYVQQREILIKLQIRFRATVLMRSTRQEYLDARQKIIKIQKYFRSYLLTRSMQAKYQECRSAAMRMQRWYRATMNMRKEKAIYRKKRFSAIVIQRKWRATVAARLQQQIFKKSLQNITLIQRAVRATLAMRQERLNYQEKRNAAIILQRSYRARCEMLKIRNQYLLVRSLIICIQRKFRANLSMLIQRRDFLLLRKTTVHIQQRFRGRIKMRSEQMRFQRLRRCVIDFQRHVRGYLAREHFHAMMTPEYIAHLNRKKASRVIQRYWRGYRIRKRLQNKKIIQIRMNIEALKKDSQCSNTIRCKMQEAVRILSGRYSASEALHVLMRLDRLSRTVPQLLTDHSDFVLTFCYDIMAQTIRSEVDKQLIRYCSRIILNMARYNSMSANTFQQGGLVTIAQMLLRWCDKDCEIFNTLCTLIWIFAHCPHKREIIRQFMTTPEAIYVVRETKKLVARKEKMNQNVRNPIARTQRDTQQNFSSRTLPSLEPDYGVVNSKPYTFISSIYAFDTILCKLGIDIF